MLNTLGWATILWLRLRLPGNPPSNPCNAAACRPPKRLFRFGSGFIFLCLSLSIQVDQRNQDFLSALQSAYGRREEFYLFASVMEATMLDKRLSDKSLQGPSINDIRAERRGAGSKE